VRCVPRGSARTVLLVDHGPALRTTVHLHLGKRGALEFVEAADGAGAAAVLRGRQVHLVIAHVAEGGERALVDALRPAGPQERAVPLVLVGSGADLRSAAAQHPRCAVVSAPVTWPRLRAAIAAVEPDWE
jgi:CheY-like chemotaxis protein